eukprot:1025099-Amphidinium_carterae.1
MEFLGLGRRSSARYHNASVNLVPDCMAGSFGSRAARGARSVFHQALAADVARLQLPLAESPVWGHARGWDLCSV